MTRLVKGYNMLYIAIGQRVCPQEPFYIILITKFSTSRVSITILWLRVRFIEYSSTVSTSAPAQEPVDCFSRIQSTAVLDYHGVRARSTLAVVRDQAGPRRRGTRPACVANLSLGFFGAVLWDI